MTTYKPFSILVVPFPFTDTTEAKRRPALVISHEQFQKYTDHITLLMITSAKHSDWYGDYLITDIEAAGLKAPSIIRQKFFTLDSRLILEKIGSLSTADKQAVLKHTQKHLALF